MNNDLISRDALLTCLQEYLNQEVGPDNIFTDMGEGIDLAMERVNDAPAVDAELVRHGRWRYGTCSVCEEMCIPYKPPYCPNCGAKMDAEVE